MMKPQSSLVILLAAFANLLIFTLANPVKSGHEESNEESLNRFMNDASYRAGYERAVYDLYAGRFQDVYNSEIAYPTPSKKAIDLGLGRFNSGSRAASSLMALDSANFAGGPGRK